MKRAWRAKGSPPPEPWGPDPHLTGVFCSRPTQGGSRDLPKVHFLLSGRIFLSFFDNFCPKWHFRPIFGDKVILPGGLPEIVHQGCSKEGGVRSACLSIITPPEPNFFFSGTSCWGSKLFFRVFFWPVFFRGESVPIFGTIFQPESFS